MSFYSPEWLWGLASLPLLALAFYGLARRRRKLWNRLADPGSARRIDLSRSGRRPLIRSMLLLLATGLVFVALARPQWGESEEELHARGLDVVLALDLSRSMLAEDLAPSRLRVAHAVARELGRRLPSDRVGLIGFAGSAGTLCPLTLDRGSLELYLGAADPSIFPDQGTDLGAAITAAEELFVRRESTRRILVLLSDGEDQESGAVAAAARAREAGIRIYSIGLGTLAGAPIPLRDESGAVTGYLKDRAGNVVTTQLAEAALAQVAETTGGAYVRATGFGQGLETLIESLSRLERDELAQVFTARRADRYRWPLLAVFLLAVVEAMLVDRRKRS